MYKRKQNATGIQVILIFRRKINRFTMLKLVPTTQKNFSFLPLSNIVSKGFVLKTAPNIECIFNCFMFPRDWEKPSFHEKPFPSLSF